MPATAFFHTFEPVPASVTRARRFARGLDEHLPEPARCCLELVVSELATNAVVHARSTFDVAVSLGEPIRVEVADASVAPPVVRDVTPWSPTGRGLRLVDACAENWGYNVRRGGKVVWVELHGEGPTLRAGGG